MKFLKDYKEKSEKSQKSGKKIQKYNLILICQKFDGDLNGSS